MPYCAVADEHQRVASAIAIAIADARPNHKPDMRLSKCCVIGLAEQIIACSSIVG